MAKKNSRSVIPPYKNVSLKDLKGEQWENIPGLGDYFMVSDYGRIKRLQYEVQYRNGAIYTKPEKIIKPYVIKSFNKYKKDYTFFLVSRVGLRGSRYSFTIARLVYSCFVEPLGSADDEWAVICKNLDNFDVRPSNLELVNRSTRQLRIVERKRFKSPLLDISKQQRAETRKKIVRAVSKQVTQYNLSGKKIKTFPSMAAAKRATGIEAASIGQVAAGDGFSAGNFVWRFGDAPFVDVNIYKESKRTERRRKFGQRVTQYDLTGKRIACYPSIQDAQEKLGTRGSAISQCLKGKYKSYKGYIWKKGYGKPIIDLSGYKWGISARSASQTRKIRQYDLKGRHIRTFPSVQEAAAAMGVKKSSLYGACSGQQKTCMGHRWRYA